MISGHSVPCLDWLACFREASAWLDRTNARALPTEARHIALCRSKMAGSGDPLFAETRIRPAILCQIRAEFGTVPNRCAPRHSARQALHDRSRLGKPSENQRLPMF